MEDKRLALTTTLDESKIYLELDKIGNISMTLNSVVSEYPLIEGDSISDHMYRQPNSIIISGTFSEQGRLSNNRVLQECGNRLSELQKVFERLKDERIMIDILSVFNVRENYVLQNIQWTEYNNTLDYTFTFKEVYVAKLNEYDYEVDSKDENLPNLTYPLQLNLSESLIDWEEIDIMVIRALNEAKLLDEGFLLTVSDYLASDAVRNGTLLVGIAGVAIGVKIITTAIAIGTGIPGVGWVVAGIGALALGLYFGLTALKKQVERSKYAIKIFKNYRDERRRRAEHDRFFEFLNQIHTQIKTLDKVARVFSITENESQKCLLNINGEYYNFIFERNNTNNYWSLLIKDVEENIISDVPQMIGLKSIADATPNNDLFATKNGTYVYLLNSKLVETKTFNDYEDNRNYYYGDLKNFMFFITTVNMSNWNNMLMDIIANAMKV